MDRPIGAEPITLSSLSNTGEADVHSTVVIRGSRAPRALRVRALGPTTVRSIRVRPLLQRKAVG